MSMIKFYQAGGFFMHFILLVGFIATGIVIERAIALYKNYRQAPADLRNKLLTFISLGQFNEAKSYVEMAAPNTAMGRVVTAGLTVRQAGGGDVKRKSPTSSLNPRSARAVVSLTGIACSRCAPWLRRKRLLSLLPNRRPLRRPLRLCQVMGCRPRCRA